jgi:ABC-type transport system substrate-binding protein
MHLKQPDAGLLSKLAVGWAIIFPSELPWDALKETVIGTGPFIWKEYVTGAGSTTVRNPDYFRQGYPCLDGVRNYVFKDPTVALASLRARQLDINSYMQYIYPADAKLLQEKHPEIIVSLPPRLWWHSIAGKIGEAPWNDRRVRQAFSRRGHSGACRRKNWRRFLVPRIRCRCRPGASKPKNCWQRRGTNRVT